MNFDSLEYGGKRETLKANRKGQNIVERIGQSYTGGKYMNILPHMENYILIKACTL